MTNAFGLAIFLSVLVMPCAYAGDTGRFSYHPTHACNGMKHEVQVRIKTVKHLSNSSLVSSAKKTLVERLRHNVSQQPLKAQE